MLPEKMKPIIENVNSAWDKDHIIRYFYYTLAPFFQRDLQYFLATEEEKFKQYQQGFINRGFHIVCSTLVDFYINLFHEFDIEAKKIKANSAKIPLFAIIVKGEHGWFYMDPLKDLFPNQYGLATTEFGVIPHYNTLKQYTFLDVLPKEYIKKLDKDLGIPEPLNDYFQKLHLAMTDKNSLRSFFNQQEFSREELFELKMNLANTKLINLGKVTGPFERVQLYLFLERTLFYKTEKKNLKIWLNTSFFPPRSCIEYTNFYTQHSIKFEENKINDLYRLIRK